MLYIFFEILLQKDIPIHRSNLTVYQFYDLIDRYTLYINWDLDLRQRLAGGTPDSKPDN